MKGYSVIDKYINVVVAIALTLGTIVLAVMVFAFVWEAFKHL